MIIHDTEHGADELDIDRTRAQLEEALGVTFEAHHGAFWNGLYYLWEDGTGQSIRIADNRDGEPEGVLFPWHVPAVTVVLAVIAEASTALREGLAAAAGLRLLKSAERDTSAVRPVLGYDTYGSPSLCPGPLRDRVAALLGLAFSPLVDDLFDGECFHADGPGHEEVSIYDNRNPDPDIRVSSVHPDMTAIMTVDATERSAQLRAVLAGVDGLVLLNHGER